MERAGVTHSTLNLPLQCLCPVPVPIQVPAAVLSIQILASMLGQVADNGSGALGLAA